MRRRLLHRDAWPGRGHAFDMARNISLWQPRQFLSSTLHIRLYRSGCIQDGRIWEDEYESGAQPSILRSIPGSELPKYREHVFTKPVLNGDVILMGSKLWERNESELNIFSLVTLTWMEPIPMFNDIKIMRTMIVLGGNVVVGTCQTDNSDLYWMRVRAVDSTFAQVWPCEKVLLKKNCSRVYTVVIDEFANALYILSIKGRYQVFEKWSYSPDGTILGATESIPFPEFNEFDKWASLGEPPCGCANEREIFFFTPEWDDESSLCVAFIKAEQRFERIEFPYLADATEKLVIDKATIGTLDNGSFVFFEKKQDYVTPSDTPTKGCACWIVDFRGTSHNMSH